MVWVLAKSKYNLYCLVIFQFFDHHFQYNNDQPSLNTLPEYQGSHKIDLPLYIILIDA